MPTILLIPEGAIVRDLQQIPYRKTRKYAAAVAAAAIQKARMHHTVHQLWASESGQSTSGMLRTPGRI